MRVLSLFAGIGGIDLGLEAHGCTTVAYSEIDPYASRVMARRFPNAVNLGDITTIDWEVANREHGPFDIICGGFPCQDISLAGKGAGIADGTRSGLWSCYADAVRVIRPRGVLVENVSALLARGIDRVLGDLAACGYDAEWDCVPAASVGAPHLRDRVFIVAYRSDACAEGADTYSDGCEVEPERERHSRRINDREQRHDAHGFCGSNERRAATTVANELGAQVPHQRRQPAIEQSRRPSSAWGSWTTPAGSDWWRVEPGVGRVAHGIPARVDRLRCLGNAVVPQVAEHVAGILMERMDGAA